MKHTIWLIICLVLVFVLTSCTSGAPRNFYDLQELEDFLAQDLTEDEDYDDFLPYALKLQSNALSEGYVININYTNVDLGDGKSYTLVTNSAIAGKILYSIIPCNLFLDVRSDLTADSIQEILTIP